MWIFYFHHNTWMHCPYYMQCILSLLFQIDRHTKVHFKRIFFPHLFVLFKLFFNIFKYIQLILIFKHHYWRLHKLRTITIGCHLINIPIGCRAICWATNKAELILHFYLIDLSTTNCFISFMQIILMINLMENKLIQFNFLFYN